LPQKLSNRAQDFTRNRKIKITWFPKSQRGGHDKRQKMHFDAKNGRQLKIAHGNKGNGQTELHRRALSWNPAHRAIRESPQGWLYP
jgi:hypothetical protein